MVKLRSCYSMYTYIIACVKTKERTWLPCPHFARKYGAVLWNVCEACRSSGCIRNAHQRVYILHAGCFWCSSVFASHAIFYAPRRLRISQACLICMLSFYKCSSWFVQFTVTFLAYRILRASQNVITVGSIRNAVDPLRM